MVIYGMQLPIQTLTRTLRMPWEDDASVADLVDIASAADRSGMDFIGVCDHVAIPDNDYAKNMTTTWYDTVATLGYLAAQTTTVKLLSVVWIAAYRHPLQTAKSFSTLAHLSGGRTILGVGAGHVEAEFDALGVPFKKRGKILDETLEAVQGTLGTEFASHHGEHYSYADVGIGPQPPNGELPVWVGGNSPAAWRRAGRFGTGYIPMGNPKEQIPEIMGVVEQAAAEAGRSVDGFAMGYMPGLIYVGELDFDTGGWPAISGSPEQIAAALQEAGDLGATTLHLRFANRSKAELSDQIEAFGSEVAPLLR
ncbi:MAG: TIGR03619 family F420-dependent LLM class oxidoreductase [Acidimicrobiales bacterium]|nr:TIGR03619 family F420-dependent LLM class oxidoreductase [Acidimicrobiales bacterium]